MLKPAGNKKQMGLSSGIKARIFRHGTYDGCNYWVEMWEDAEGLIHVQRVSLRGIGEFKRPLGDQARSIDAVDQLMIAVRYFVKQCIGGTRLPADEDAPVEECPVA